jgi:hypothetical protein
MELGDGSVPRSASKQRAANFKRDAEGFRGPTVSRRAAPLG